MFISPGKHTRFTSCKKKNKASKNTEDKTRPQYVMGHREISKLWSISYNGTTAQS
jgi:hypothetical protein